MFSWFKKIFGIQQKDDGREALPAGEKTAVSVDYLSLAESVDESELPELEFEIEEEIEEVSREVAEEIKEKVAAQVNQEVHEQVRVAVQEEFKDEIVEELTEKIAGEIPAVVEVREEKAAEEPELVEEEAGLTRKLKDRLAKTRQAFIDRVDSVFLGKKKIDPSLFDDLEEILITADVGVSTTLELLEEARKEVDRDRIDDPAVLKEILKKNIQSVLDNTNRVSELTMPEKGPLVIMVLGVNGVGKTTTIGKMAYKYLKSGKKVLLVAGDTFRAAASEQLQAWGKRIGVDVVAKGEGADPSAVIFDGLERALSEDIEVVIVDTAGRMHTKVNLIEELKKIKRVMGKKVPEAPHEIILVLDATTGQNALSQAKLFNEAVEITGLALTKLDGTAKGGIVINISREFNIPIRFIGIGEQMEDLRDFDPKEFAEALF